MEQNCYYSIASGSSGNCGLYIAGNTRILIDLGVSVRRLTAALRRLGLTIEMLDAVLLTHEHIDHVKGLATFAKRHTVPVYATKGTAEALLTKNPDAKKLLRPYWGGETFTIGTVDVQSFLTPHDAAESVGYILRTHRHTFGFATDLGFVPSAVEKLLVDCDAVVLESNHDLDMLRIEPVSVVAQAACRRQPRAFIQSGLCSLCGQIGGAWGTYNSPCTFERAQ